MSFRLISTLTGALMMVGALVEAPVVVAAPMQVPSDVVGGASQSQAATNVYYCRFGRCYRRYYGYRRYYYPRYYYGYRRYYAPGLTFRLF